LSSGRRTLSLFVATIMTLAVQPGFGGTVLVASSGDAIALTPDVDGPDDVSSQNDVSQLGFDEGHLPTYFSARFSLDDTDWLVDTDWSGASTGDACAVIDTDSDGNANFTVCAEVQDVGADGDADHITTVLNDCLDNRENRCFGSGGGPVQTALPTYCGGHRGRRAAAPRRRER
jgi:hypothetical protein